MPKVFQPGRKPASFATDVAESSGSSPVSSPHPTTARSGPLRHAIMLGTILHQLEAVPGCRVIQQSEKISVFLRSKTDQATCCLQGMHFLISPFSAAGMERFWRFAEQALLSGKAYMPVVKRSSHRYGKGNPQPLNEILMWISVIIKCIY
ncbi:hypothetical protein D3C77_473950 [compost metagenome]